MDNIDDKLKSRLGKLLELARRGVGGEKDNAARMLENLLRKHGLTMADLEDREDAAPVKTWFAFKGADEGKLLNQVVASVVNNAHEWSMWEKVGVRNRRAFELTPAEAADVAVRFEVYRRELAAHLRKERKLAFSAFIQANRIFSDKPAGGAKAPTLSPEEWRDLMRAMGAVKPTPIHKAIGHAA